MMKLIHAGPIGAEIKPAASLHVVEPYDPAVAPFGYQKSFLLVCRHHSQRMVEWVVGSRRSVVSRPPLVREIPGANDTVVGTRVGDVHSPPDHAEDAEMGGGCADPASRSIRGGPVDEVPFSARQQAQPQIALTQAGRNFGGCVH